MSSDTTWTHLSTVTTRLTDGPTDAFRDRLERYGLVAAPSYQQVVPGRRGVKTTEFPMTAEQTTATIIRRDLFGDEKREGIVRLKSTLDSAIRGVEGRYQKRVHSFFRKKEGRWHKCPYVLSSVHPDGTECAEETCVAVVKTGVEGAPIVVIEGDFLRGYRLSAKTPLPVLKTSLQKTDSRDLSRTEATFRWGRSLGETGRFLVLKKNTFSYRYEPERHDQWHPDPVDVVWQVGALTPRTEEAQSGGTLSRPTGTSLKEIGVTVADTGRQPHVSGSLEALQKRLEQTTRPDSLSARLQRHGLVPDDGLTGDGPLPAPDDVSVDVFWKNLYGTPLREGIVQVRANGRFYSLTFFDAVAGGWKRQPGILTVRPNNKLDHCAGGFCFEFVEARAAGEYVLEGRVGHADGAVWMPVQGTPQGPLPLAREGLSSETTVDWVQRTDLHPSAAKPPYPRYALHRMPSDEATVDSLQTTLPHDRTGEGETIRVAALAYRPDSAVGRRSKSKMSARQRDSLWQRGARVGGESKQALPALSPLSFHAPTTEEAGDSFYGLVEGQRVNSRHWLIGEPPGSMSRLRDEDGLYAYLHDIRRAIEQRAWGRLRRVAASSLHRGRPVGPDSLVASLRRLANSRSANAALTVSYDRWTYDASVGDADVPPPDGRPPLLRIDGTISFTDEWEWSTWWGDATTSFHLWFDRYRGKVYLVAAGSTR